MSFRDDMTYLKSIRNYIAVSVFLFALTALMGYFAAALDPELAAEWTSQLKALKWIMDQPPILIMMIIFFKNLLACALSVLLGIGLGLVPLMVVTTNGFLLGIVAYGAIQKEGVLYLIAGIMPHGIIELPIVLLSIAIGFRLGYLLVMTVAREEADLAGET
ncbi:MAG: stage II sporulation protein M, partial [Methanothrix sp.]|nr:stage II sporulation protein M [Methanothrix sp.]